MNGNIDLSKNYILITPCKNEGENLPSLIDSIATQEIQPIVWVIVDDGSTDDTPDILNNYQKQYGWIKVLHLSETPRDIGLHLAEVMNNGFNYAIDFCKENELEYNYLGNVDGDLILPPSFFKNLINEFNKNQRLGIASGGTDYTINNKKVRAKLSENEPSGGHMLISRICFNECGGVPISHAADSVFKAKARLRNWQTKRFENNIATEIRDVGNAEGYWKGKVQSGKAAYHLNLNPLHVFVRSIKYTLKKPYYIGMAYLFGYLSDLIKRKEQIKDSEIKYYFWNKWKAILNVG